jgi:HPt (histidine-containing phosphotransfer) domain-containing protein
MNEFQIPLSLKEKYMERRRADIKICEQALLDKNFEFLSHHGHQIKGNAATYGFDKLGELGAQLEIHSKQENESEIKVILEQYKLYIINIPLIK